MYADRLLPQQQLSQIRFSYAIGILIVEEKLEHQLIQASQAKQQIELAEKTINDNWTAYLKTDLTPKESDIVKQTSLLKAEADKAITRLKQKIDSKDPTLSSEIMNKEMLSTINPVIANINELLQLQIAVSNELYKSNDLLFSTTKTSFYVLAVSFLIIALVMGYFIVQDNRKFIKVLKTSNSRIKEAEEKYRAFKQYAVDSIFVTNKHLQITDVNESASKLLGFSYNELLQMNISDLILPAEKESHLTKVETILKEGHSLHERKLLKKNGSIADTEINVRVLKGIGFIALVRDLTERRNSQIAIKESEEKYHYLFQNSPECIVIWDLESLDVLEVNNQVVERYGYTREEWANMTVLQYRPKEDHDLIKEFSKRLLSENITTLKKTWRHLKKNGEEMWMEITSHKIVYSNRKAILALCRDVTELLRAEKQIIESEEKYRNIFNNAIEGMYRTSIEGKPLLANPALAKIFGYSTTEEYFNAIVDSSNQIWANAQDRLNYISLLEKQGFVKGYESQAKRKDGTIIWTSLDAKLFRDSKDNLIYSEGFIIDIDERKKAEIAIKEQAEIFSAIIENASESIILLSPDLKVLELNKTARDRVMANASKEIFKGADFRDFFYTNTKDIFMKMFDSALAGNYVDEETSQPNAEAKLFWIRTRMYPVYNTTKKLLGITVLVEDISNRKEVEKKLEKSEEKLNALIENISDGIVLVDRDGNLTYQSPSVEHIVGWTLEERKDKKVLDLIHPDDLKICTEHYEQSINNPGVVIQSQYRGLHKNGFYIWLEISIKNLLDNQLINSFVIIYKDITERKKFEEQQLLMSSIVNSSDDAILSITLDGFITSWNAGAEKILGYTAHEIIGKNIAIIRPPALIDEENDILQKIQKGQSVDHFETTRIKKDGSSIFVSISISPILDSWGNVLGTSKVLRDITELKLYEQKLAKAAIKAQEDERYEIGGELHDNVCQILATSMIYLGMMKKKLPPDSNEHFIQIQNYISVALNEIRNLSHRLAPASFDNETLESSFLKLLKSYNADDRYVIALNYNIEVKRLPLSHELQLNLYRILQEQLRNILKHANATAIDVALFVHDNSLQMTIKDNGIGFNSKANYEGIGMASMMRRVQLFSGSFKVASAIGAGCEVVVNIPLSNNN